MKKVIILVSEFCVEYLSQESRKFFQKIDFPAKNLKINSKKQKFKSEKSVFLLKKWKI